MFTGAYFCVRMGLSTQHLHMLFETLHLSSLLSWFEIDLSPDSQAMQGAGHLMVTFVIYKLVRRASIFNADATHVANAFQGPSLMFDARVCYLRGQCFPIRFAGVAVLTPRAAKFFPNLRVRN